MSVLWCAQAISTVAGHATGKMTDRQRRDALDELCNIAGGLDISQTERKSALDGIISGGGGLVDQGGPTTNEERDQGGPTTNEEIDQGGPTTNEERELLLTLKREWATQH